MKRHPSLVPLSREHHNALLLAQLLKISTPDYKGLPTTIEEKAKYASELYKNVLINHFKAEEKLLKLASNCNEELTIISKEIFNEHVQLTDLFMLLEKENVTEKLLDQLGTMLEMHIRKEERVLFPLLEKYCSDAILSDWILLN